MFKKLQNWNLETGVEKLFILSLAIIPFLLILSPIIIGLLIVLVVISSNYRLSIKRLMSNKVALLLVLYYLLQFFGYLVTFQNDSSLDRITFQIMLLIVPLIYITINPSNKLIDSTFYYFVWSLFLFVIIAFIKLGYHFYIDYLHRNDYNFIQTSLYHYHYPYDVLFINVANVILIFSKRFTLKLQIIISLSFLIFIVLSGTRIGLFSYVLITLIFAIINYKKLLNIKTLFVFILVSGMCLLFVNQSRYANDKFYGTLSKIGFNTQGKVSSIGEDYHKVSLRRQLWDTSINVIESKFIFGYGPKSSRLILNKAYKSSNNEQLVGLNSHNQYLSTWLESGIIGLIILFLIIIILGYKLIIIKRLDLFLILFIIVIALFTESFLLRQKGIMFLASIFMLLSFHINFENKSKSKPLNKV